MVANNIEARLPSGTYYLPERERAPLIVGAQQSGHRVFPCNMASADSFESALVILGQALQLPEWFGANLDALADCLTDPELLPAEGSLVLLDGIAHLRRIAPAQLPDFIDLLLNIGEARRAESAPLLWIMLDAPVRGLPTAEMA